MARWWLILSAAVAGVIVIIVSLGVALKIYVKHTRKWCKSHTCLVGKTAIVTGANTGIGYETALDFAKRGARVILGCRDEARGEAARAKIVEKTGNQNVVLRIIDMASFASVRAFAKTINETEDRLDILVNNAGVGAIDKARTEDGHDKMMQINYFSPFLLTLLLTGLLKKTKTSRIVNVSSLLPKFLSGFDVNHVDEHFGAFRTDGYSKLCNILFTIEYAKKLAGTGITTYSLNPGPAKTEINRNITGFKGIFTAAIINLFYGTSAAGAQTTLYCSLEKGLEVYNGEHFDNCQKVKRYETAEVPGLSKKLWEVTENIVQLKPEEIQFWVLIT